MKILNLILFSHDEKFSKMRHILEKWLTFQQKNLIHFDYYFYSCRRDLDKDYLIQDHDIFIKCIDSIHPGVLYKTKKVFKIAKKNFQFDYLVRSNISTVIDFISMSNYFHKNSIDYGGIPVHKLGLSKRYNVTDEKYLQIKYAYGFCMIFSKKSIDLLNNSTWPNVIDDLSIGYVMYNNNITLVSLVNKYHWVRSTHLYRINNFSIYDKFIFRNKYNGIEILPNDRTIDMLTLSKYVSLLLNKHDIKKYNMRKIIYGLGFIVLMIFLFIYLDQTY